MASTMRAFSSLRARTKGLWEGRARFGRGARCVGRIRRDVAPQARARGRKGRNFDARGGGPDFEREWDDERAAGDGVDEAARRKNANNNSESGRDKSTDRSASGNGKKKTQVAQAAPLPGATPGAQEDIPDDGVAELIEGVVMDAKEEEFALKKKRMQLIIEEKEWDLESPTTSQDEKMFKLVEYVNAVEAFKELCSNEVPNTVGDLLGQYVMVHHLEAGAPGYDEAMAFLELDDEDEEVEEELDLNALQTIADLQTTYSRDDDDDEDDDDEEEEFTIEISFGDDDFEPVSGLHCAQDIEGNWRWLEDDLGRSFPTKPFGEFTTKLMAVEYMLKAGLNVNSLHEEVDPLELMNFSGCKSWEDTLRVANEASATLKNLQETGWRVDTRSWCNEHEHLIVVKELVPLKTMSMAIAEPVEEEDAIEEQE